MPHPPPPAACAELGNGADILMSYWVGRRPQEATPQGCVLLILSLSSPASGSALHAAPTLLPSHPVGRVVLMTAPRAEEAVLLVIWMQVEVLGACHVHSW